MPKRTEADLSWSELRQSHVCLHCGQLVMLIADVVYHADDECESEEEPESCASEGYAVFQADQ